MQSKVPGMVISLERPPPDMTLSKQGEIDVVDMLSIFSKGTLKVGVNGGSFLKVDVDSQTIDIEAKGLKESGIQVSTLVRTNNDGGIRKLLRSSRSMAKKFSEKGWRVALSDRGSSVMRLGRGVSKVSGYITINPMKIRTILEILQ
jgi:hypothetical protein